jgi:hypothetical protein
MVPLSIWNPHLRLFEDRTFTWGFVPKCEPVEKFQKSLNLDRQSPDEFDNNYGITRKSLYRSTIPNHQLQLGSLAAS